MNERERALLEQRTRRYAAALETDDQAQVLGTFVGCRISETLVGLPVAIVHEFAALERWTPLRGQRFVLGATQVRGEVMALVDLLEGLLARASGECGWMVVLQGRGGRAAAPISEMLGTRIVLASELLPAAQAPLSARGIVGTTGDLWLLLDAAETQSLLEPAT
jgi:chemotaxis signal transduction protein